MVGLQTLDLAIGVRVPASQFKSDEKRAAAWLPFFISSAAHGAAVVSA